MCLKKSGEVTGPSVVYVLPVGGWDDEEVMSNDITTLVQKMRISLSRRHLHCIPLKQHPAITFQQSSSFDTCCAVSMQNIPFIHRFCNSIALIKPVYLSCNSTSSLALQSSSSTTNKQTPLSKTHQHQSVHKPKW